MDRSRSPDLTPCGFFLWCHLKNFVYLREEIVPAVMPVRPINEMWFGQDGALTFFWEMGTAIFS